LAGVHFLAAAQLEESLQHGGAFLRQQPTLHLRLVVELALFE
jgi:hypothetical protein